MPENSPQEAHGTWPTRTFLPRLGDEARKNLLLNVDRLPVLTKRLSAMTAYDAAVAGIGALAAGLRSRTSRS